MSKHKHKQSTRSLILERLGMMTFVKPVGYWLDTGYKEFNAALGSEKKGLPTGRIFELAGKNHAGKTLIANWLAGKAQRDFKAFVIEIQLEGSHDKPWSIRLGVKFGSKWHYLLQPRILIRAKVTKGDEAKAKRKKKSASKAFLQSAELIFKEAEEVMLWVKEQWPKRPIFVFLDSLANLQTEMQVDAAGESNMRSNMDRAQFLSRILPRWCSLAMNYDAWIFLLNQVRTNPRVLFGSPEYAPGGSAAAHNAHSRVWVRRIKNGKLMKMGKQIGLKGKIINYKNKSGGGSEADRECGFQINFIKKPTRMLKAMTIKEASGEE